VRRAACAAALSTVVLATVFAPQGAEAAVSGSEAGHDHHPRTVVRPFSGEAVRQPGLPQTRPDGVWLGRGGRVLETRFVQRTGDRTLSFDFRVTRSATSGTLVARIDGHLRYAVGTAPAGPAGHVASFEIADLALGTHTLVVAVSATRPPTQVLVGRFRVIGNGRPVRGTPAPLSDGARIAIEVLLAFAVVALGYGVGAAFERWRFTRREA
jgi:hypothetical protein